MHVSSKGSQVKRPAPLTTDNESNKERRLNPQESPPPVIQHSLLSLTQADDSTSERALQHIGAYLLPAPTEEAPTPADRLSLAQQSIRDCQRTARVNREWRKAMQDVLRQGATILLQARLAMQSPQQWLHDQHLSPHQKALSVHAPPDLFKWVPDFSHIAARAEGLLIEASRHIGTFGEALDILLLHAHELAEVDGLPAKERQRLRSLPQTALAILYSRGFIVQDMGLFADIAERLLKHAVLLDEARGQALLRNLMAVIDAHFAGQLQPLRQRIVDALSDLPLTTRETLRPGSDSEPATIEEKTAYTKYLVNMPSPLGPFCILELSQILREWQEPTLRAAIVESVSEVLADAVAGNAHDEACTASFLFSLFPLDVLRDAFRLTGMPHQARLLQLEQTTETSNELLLDFCQNIDVPRKDRLRALNWRADR